MKVNVRYTGYLSEVTGKGEEEFKGIGSLEELLSLLARCYSGFEKYYCTISVNGKLEKGEVQLADNDDIMLLCPFAGG